MFTYVVAPVVAAFMVLEAFPGPHTAVIDQVGASGRAVTAIFDFSLPGGGRRWGMRAMACPRELNTLGVQL